MSKAVSPVKIDGVTITPEAREFLITLFGDDETAKSNHFPDDTTSKEYINTLVNITFLLIGLMDSDVLIPEKSEIQKILYSVKYMHEDISKLHKGFLNWLHDEKENN